MNELVARIDKRLIAVLSICSILLLGIGGYLLWLDTNPGASADDGNRGPSLSFFANATSEVIWEHYAIEALSISEIAAVDNEKFLIGTDGATLSSFDPISNTLETIHSEGRTNIIQTVLQQDDDTWIGYVFTGLVHYGAAGMSVINIDSGLLSNSVSAVAVDANNQLWVGHAARGLGMSGGGLSYQVNGTWQTMQTFDGLGSNNVSDIEIDRYGNVWVAVTDYTNYLGPQHGGLLKYDGSEWHVYGAAEGLISSDVRSMTITDNGDVWITTTSGVSMYRQGLWFNYNSTNGLASDFVLDIESDTQGRVWAATYAGVSVFDGASWGTLTQAEGLQSDMVNALAADENGGMLIATQAGVSRITVNIDMPEPTSVIYHYHLPMVISE